jgi:hypothetical protein
VKCRNRYLPSSIALAVSSMVDPGSAQRASTPAADADSFSLQKLERVEATGFSLRCLDAEDALPITLIKADLRGIGLNRTLVPRNGQRLANEPTQDDRAYMARVLESRDGVATL